VVGRIFKVHAAPEGTPWTWTLAYGYHYDPHTDAWPRSHARGRHGGFR